MTLQKYAPRSPRKYQRNLWFERVMAVTACVNLTLVVFDLTYVPWRNFWLQGNIPIPFTSRVIRLPIPQMDCQDTSVTPPQRVKESAITCLYDPVKGIEPHRDTEKYLNTVATLIQQVNQKGVETGLQSPEVQTTLAELRQQSTDMINTNPFAAVGKSGTLEKIKHRMRNYVASSQTGKSRQDLSAKQAFNIFWSTPYLSATTWQERITWFNQEISPLIATNYYRSISENGDFTNNFWVLDTPFIILFGLEFLARTFYISRRYKSLNWLDAMIWRWYDVPLFIPFSLFVPALALTRTLPTMIRLHQAKILDLHQLIDQARQGFVGSIAEDIAEVVVVQVINQLQNSIQRGEFTELLERTTSRKYVDINNVNEVEAIAQHMTQLVVYQVFPKVQPNLEALLSQTINSVLSQSPAYRSIQALPGIGGIPNQITQRLVADITQICHNSLKAVLEDPKTMALTAQLVRTTTNTLITEAQQESNLDELQGLVSDMLEEIKINYIQRLSTEDTALLLDQTRHLQKIARKSP